MEPRDFQQKAIRKERDQGAALQRLLAIKGPVRAQKGDEQPFLDALDEVLAAMDRVDAQSEGWLNGSMSGQCWQDFMEGLRFDLLTRLQQYRDGAQRDDFSPASLTALKAERQRAERLYIRDLVAIYQNAAQIYKTISG